MEKKTNKAKLEIFKFLRKLAESQGNSINIPLQGYFYENSAKKLAEIVCLLWKLYLINIQIFEKT